MWSHHRILAFNKETDPFSLDEFRTSLIENCNGLSSVYDIQASQLQLTSDIDDKDNNKFLNKQVCCLLDEPVFIKKFYFGPSSDQIKLTDLFSIDCKYYIFLFIFYYF